MKIQRLSVAISACVFTISSNATLIDRGGGLIYDDVLDVTWLQDANYAMTTGFSTDGNMDWNIASFWAGNLNYFDSIRNVTWSDWRLASMDVDGDGQTVNCAGASITELECRDNELSYNYHYNIPGIAGTNKSGNAGSFVNIQGIYWSDTTTNSIPPNVWTFDYTNRSQLTDDMADNHAVWLVRDGDVAAVPLPAAIYLFGSGLIGLVVATRKRTA